ncbi:hypothetical protein C5167_003389 [Papaver somniferum]|uniref:Uncharacterized protein n=1 Tax=Papaver somniferum TaxID=3469 RepID=A0A4Y7KW08_PAPSO|nr:hypothetical protein C5167_003389 [Papaver somniferum]
MDLNEVEERTVLKLLLGMKVIGLIFCSLDSFVNAIEITSNLYGNLVANTTAVVAGGTGVIARRKSTLTVSLVAAAGIIKTSKKILGCEVDGPNGSVNYTWQKISQYNI